jgi:hypothetical protein
MRSFGPAVVLLALGGVAHADDGSDHANGGVNVTSHPRPHGNGHHGLPHVVIAPPRPVVVVRPPVIVVRPPPPPVVVVSPPPPPPVVVVAPPPPPAVMEVSSSSTTDVVVSSAAQVDGSWYVGGHGSGIDPLAVAHWEASVAMLVATELGADGPTLGASLGGQLGPVRLSVDYMRYQRDELQASRLGITARYRVSMNLDDAGLGLYLEAGAGRESRTNDLRMHESVATALVGAGLEFLMGERKSAGFDLGIRGIIDADDQLVGLVQVGVLLGSR